MYRLARDRALTEVAERQKVESALRSSVEERKRAMARLATLSRKVLAAQEQERERLSRELHDELGQLLTALRLEMGWLQKQITRATGEDGGMFDNTITLAESATDELRRICKGLRPPLLDDLGLEPALRQLVAEFEERADVAVDLQIRIGDEKRLRGFPEVALCAYRIVQESLTNVRRHSEARNVRVTLILTGPLLAAEVVDDGVGFEAGDLGAMRGWGLEGMRERAALVGGELAVESDGGGGTAVRFRVKLEGLDEEVLT
jgi:two-component system sensor histidine kinase UhpB